ncbi:hypothetical protein [Mycobacterium sp. 852013-51886_SCH5428379]|uniref:hypothetical protein n=1 Tax=Mycobacterium sp. 852013-51886_SCH5428379 TaxID=1834111 RepID=UPI000A786CE2|nr:hypothetical protein [Mycobacterium sp. 852013-51886_SCH5428379]
MPTVSMPNRAQGRTAPDAGAALRLQYRLDVLGADAGDVVRAAGGWLFDRALAGWAVGVWLIDTRDLRALTVLGARVYPFVDAPAPAAEDEVVAGLAVAGGLVATEHAVGALVADALRTGSTEVVSWGEPCPKLGGRSTVVRYQPSAAARAFKRQALIALGGADPSVETVEMLRCGGYRPLDSDLVTTGN